MPMEEILENIEKGAQLQENIEPVLSLLPNQQEQFLEQLSRLKSENAATFLTLLYERVTDKKLRKLIKKAMFRLKTQGIHVEEPRTAEETVLRKPETSREAKAFMSNYDAEETRVVMAAFETKKNQFIFSHAITHFSNGLVELATFPVPRNELEALLKDYLWRTQPPVVLPAISAPYAGYVIEEASGLSGKESEEARSLKRFLNDMKGNVRKPQDISLLDVDAALRPEPFERIVTHHIFEPFLLRWSGLEEDQKRLNGVVNPSIIVPPYVIQERREAFLKELVENERVRAKIPFFKRMIEDYAYLFYCMEEFRNYKGLLEQLKDQERLITAFLYFVQKSFEKLEKKEEQPGVLVDPYSLTKK